MRAVVLAAGWALRMGAVAAGRPKALLPVGTRTPLDFVVDAAEAVPAMARIDLWTHEAARPAFEAWARQRRARRRAGPPLAVHGNGVRRAEARRGAVADLAAFLARAAPDEDLLVLGADLVFDFPLDPLARAARADPAVAVYDVGDRERVRRYASVALAADGRVTRLVEKDPAPATSLAATALYGIPRGALGDPARYLAEGGAPDNLGHLAEWWVARGRLRGVPVAGRWIDVGSPDEYARARREFPGSAPGAAAPGPGAS